MSSAWTEGLKELEARGACNAFKLMKILQQADHQVFFVEHDPQLYDGAAELVEDVSRAISEAAKKGRGAALFS